jgi:ankyrin repeat protein
MLNNYKKISAGMLLMFFYCDVLAMEEKAKKLNCSFAHIVPERILKKVIVQLVNGTKKTEEAIGSLRWLQYTDKATCAMVQKCLKDSEFTTLLENKLTKKLKNQFLSYEQPAREISKKLLNPAGNEEIPEFLIIDDGWYYFVPKLVRFGYMYTNDDKFYKRKLFQKFFSKNDTAMILFCLRHGAKVNKVYSNILLPHEMPIYNQESPYATWTPLAYAIDNKNPIVVQKLLELHANPDCEIRKVETIIKDGEEKSHYYYTTPRKLAEEMDDQEISELIKTYEAKKNAQRLGCSIGFILPSNIFERIVLAVLKFKNIEKMLISLKSLSGVDKETQNKMSCWLNSEISGSKMSLASRFQDTFHINIKDASAMSEAVLGSSSQLQEIPWDVCNENKYPKLVRFFCFHIQNKNNKKEYFKHYLTKNRIKTIPYCIAHGIDVNEVYENNYDLNRTWTPLSWAVTEGSVEMVEQLLKHKADPDAEIEMYYGKTTPRALAKGLDNKEKMALIENHEHSTTKE